MCVEVDLGRCLSRLRVSRGLGVLKAVDEYIAMAEVLVLAIAYQRLAPQVLQPCEELGSLVEVSIVPVVICLLCVVPCALVIVRPSARADAPVPGSRADVHARVVEALYVSKACSGCGGCALFLRRRSGRRW